MADNTSNNQGDMSVREAGHKGGEKTSQTHGKEFYQEIGQKGGEKGGKRVHDLIDKGKETENS